MTDGDLIQQYLNGDESAFTHLYQRYRKPVYGYLNGILPNQVHTVDDIFQQTWVRVIDRLPRYRERGTFVSWVFRIAHNLAMDHFRRERRFCPDDQSERRADPAQLPAERRHAEELQAALEQAVGDLPPEQREVVRLRQCGVPFGDIADIQGVGLNTALARMHYAVKRLKKELSDFSD